ncbi:MAG TPA: DUF4936 family protein [Burkholderiales bacterium]|nr:DUF4936 family protein [Burkholderiales bacterium]
MAYHYYVYYRVNPEKAAACEPRIRDLLAAVEKVTGIAGRLLKKREEPQLWMEVYENVSDQAHFEWEICDIADKFKVKEFLEHDTTRHCECFES